MPGIRVLLVEDDPVWREMLAQLVGDEPDFAVVHACCSREDALTYLSRNAVDIVLMDVNLGDEPQGGIAATLELNKMNTGTKVIVLTSYDDERVIMDAFTAGAIEFANKSDFRQIPDKIRSIAHRTSPQELLVKAFTRMKEEEQLQKLTAAEKEIIQLVQAGLGRGAIKDQLVKTDSTLKNQVTNILKKFDAKNVKEVIATIKSRGLK